jgi:hypothetical protein
VSTLCYSEACVTVVEPKEVIVQPNPVVCLHIDGSDRHQQGEILVSNLALAVKK